MSSNPSPLINRLALMPDGQRIDLDLVPQYSASGSTITFNYMGGGSTTYAANTVAVVLAQIDTIKLGQGSNRAFTIGDASSLTFVSVTPTTGVAGTGGKFDLTGTGFTTSGINTIKLDDGAGHVFFGQAFSLNSDTDITFDLYSGDITPAATFIIYYSTNSGSTWTTTGLTYVST